MEWCIDANIAVKTVDKEHLTEKAKAPISDALDTETRLIAPHFIDYVNSRTQQAMNDRKKGKKFFNLEELQKEFSEN